MTIAHPFGCEPNCFGTLTADEFSLNTYGWMVQNLSSLWFEAAVIGDNRLVPQRVGRVGYPKYLDEYQFTLVFYVTGYTDADGVIYPDPLVGLETNLETLWDNVFAPIDTGDGARSCVLTMPSGATRVAEVQFLPLRKQREIEDPMLATFLMSGIILGGRFVIDDGS